MIRKAMIMSAGVGSRLDPLTQTIPKPLVPIANVPSMDLLLNHLKKYGIEKVIANTHYCAEQIYKRYTEDIHILDFEYIHEKELSGTAGGVKKCQFFFDEGEDFLVMSADGLTDLNIEAAIKSHKESGSIATMIIKTIPHCDVCKFGVVVTDHNRCICEFQEKPTIDAAKCNEVNTGIYIFNYEIFKYIPENTVYDFAKDVFPKLLAHNIAINTFKTEDYWSDIGSIEQYIASTNDIFNNEINIDEVQIIHKEEGKLIIGEDSKLTKNVKIIGNVVIGNNCNIKPETTIKDSIIWDNVTIGENLVISDCIIAYDSIIETSQVKKVIKANSRL